MNKLRVCLKIGILNGNSLETLRVRRNNAANKELKKTRKDPINLCNRFLSVGSSEHYDLRSGNEKCIPKEISGTLRHGQSFFPRACDIARTYIS